MPTSRTGIRWEPSSAPRGSGADWDNARKYFTDRTADEWAKLFDVFPEETTRLLGEIYRQYSRVLEREATGKSSRRRILNGNLYDLNKWTTPQYSHEPFPTALTQLRGKMSLRALAMKTGIPRATIRYMTDQDAAAYPDMHRLELIANALHVSPAYFREWREGMILTALSVVMQEKPEMSVAWMRALHGMRRKSDAQAQS